VMSPLADRARLALTPLAAVPGVALEPDQLAALAGLGDDVRGVLEDLERRALVEREWDRVRATPAGVEAAAPTSEERRDWLGRVVAQFARTGAPGRDADPARRRGYAIAVLGLLARAREVGAARETLELARVADAPLALGGNWGAWRASASAAADAARETGDEAAEAWALHQLGSHAVCLDDAASATAHLGDAARIRDALGDADGAALSRHNLAQLRSAPSGNGRWRTRSIGAAGVVVVALLAAALAVGLGSGGDETGPQPPRPPGPTGPDGGTGSEPSAVVTPPTEIDFGDVNTEEVTDPVRTIMVKNTGGGILEIGDVTVVGNDLTFEQEPVFGVNRSTCEAAELGSDEHCTMEVKFRASRPPASHEAVMKILDHRGRLIDDVVLKGDAVAPTSPGTTP
jgi:hypothetical protein